MSRSSDTLRLSDEAAKLWLECLDDPTDDKIKKVGSMQHKFKLSDWDNFQEKVRLMDNPYPYDD